MISDSMLPPLRVGLAQLSESTAAMIGMALERFARDQFAVVPLPQAQVAIIDVDRSPGADAIAKLRAQHPALLLLVLTSTDSAPKDTLRLGKPISIQILLDALRSARSRVDWLALGTPDAVALPAVALPEDGENQTAHPAGPPGTGDDFCGDADDIPASAPHFGPEYARAHFDDHAGLLGALRDAARRVREQGKSHSVMGLPHALYIDVGDASRSTQVVTDLDDSTLREAAQATAGAALQCCSIAAVPQSTQGWRRISLESLLWRVAQWSARGRLPDGVNAHARVKLRAWPNFTRLSVTPHALRIAALWVTRFLSPIEVAKLLGVPQRYVFTLCAAATLGDLFEREPATPSAQAPAVAPAAVAAVPKPARGLLKRILGRLINAR